MRRARFELFCYEACTTCRERCTDLDVEISLRCDGPELEKTRCVDHVAVCDRGQTLCTFGNTRSCEYLVSNDRLNAVCGDTCVDMRQDARNRGSCVHACSKFGCDDSKCRDKTMVFPNGTSTCNAECRLLGTHCEDALHFRVPGREWLRISRRRRLWILVRVGIAGSGEDAKRHVCDAILRLDDQPRFRVLQLRRVTCTHSRGERGRPHRPVRPRDSRIALRVCAGVHVVSGAARLRRTTRSCTTNRASVDEVRGQDSQREHDHRRRRLLGAKS